MTLLQLQDVTYRYKNTAEAVLYQIKYNFWTRKNFIVSLVSQEQENPLSCPYWLV